MAKKPVIVDVFDWLASKGLLSEAAPAVEGQKRTNPKTNGILWVKRNLPGVNLISPKRGVFKADQAELDAAYEAHLERKKKVYAKKKEAAFDLNAQNYVIAKENKRRLEQNQPALGPAERAEYLKKATAIQELKEYRESNKPLSAASPPTAGPKRKGT